MSSQNEISSSLAVFKKYNKNNILLFHCISEYPACLSKSNLGMINLLKEFGTLVGLSDHTLERKASIVATTLGVSAIEKHLLYQEKIKVKIVPFLQNQMSF